MGIQQNLPHHGNLNTGPTITSRNQFIEKSLLNRLSKQQMTKIPEHDDSIEILANELKGLADRNI
jgi:hypothetical protein